MPWVVLQPLFDDALDAVHEVITKAVVTMSTRINAKRFICVVFKVKKGTLNGVGKPFVGLFKGWDHLALNRYRKNV
jgi:predicted benzoate:H+ symporter BenE